MQSMVLFLYLLGSSVSDIWKRKVSMAGSLLVVIIQIAFSVLTGKPGWLAIAGGLFVGVGILFVSRVTRGAIGRGDGILFLVVGLSLGLTDTITLLLFSLLLSACFSIFLIVVCHVGRHYSFPFVPMVCLAYGGMILFGQR